MKYPRQITKQDLLMIILVLLMALIAMYGFQPCTRDHSPPEPSHMSEPTLDGKPEKPEQGAKA